MNVQILSNILLFFQNSSSTQSFLPFFTVSFLVFWVFPAYFFFFFNKNLPSCFFTKSFCPLYFSVSFPSFLSVSFLFFIKGFSFSFFHSVPLIVFWVLFSYFLQKIFCLFFSSKFVSSFFHCFVPRFWVFSSYFYKNFPFLFFLQCYLACFFWQFPWLFLKKKFTSSYFSVFFSFFQCFLSLFLQRLLMITGNFSSNHIQWRKQQQYLTQLCIWV